MHPRTTELLDHLDRHRAELRAAVDGVPLELRSQRPTVERWSVAEVVEHLSIVEGRIARIYDKSLAEARASGIEPEKESGPVLQPLSVAAIIDRTHSIRANDAVQPKGELDAAAAWTVLEETRTKLLAAILAGDGFALGGIVQPHVVLGPLNLYQWAAFVGAHEARHAAQIREIGAQLGAPS